VTPPDVASAFALVGMIRDQLQRAAASEGIAWDAVLQSATRPLSVEGRVELLAELIGQGCEPWLIERHLQAANNRNVVAA